LRRGEHLTTHPDIDIGKQFTERADELRQHRVGGRADTSDGEPTGGAVGDAASQIGGVVHRIQDRDGAAQECQARRGQRDVAGGADQQFRAQLALELANLLRQGRLGDEQALGCASEMQFFGNRPEVPQMPQLH
jgi:hypothetical protein